MEMIMDNTEKLLRAFIEAQGYEVEETPIVFKSVTDGSMVQVGVNYKVTKKECNYANAASPDFTTDQRVGFIDREIKTLNLKKERLLSEKD